MPFTTLKYKLNPVYFLFVFQKHTPRHDSLSQLILPDGEGMMPGQQIHCDFRKLCADVMPLVSVRMNISLGFR